MRGIPNLDVVILDSFPARVSDYQGCERYSAPSSSVSHSPVGKCQKTTDVVPKVDQIFMSEI